MGRYAYFSTDFEYKFVFGLQSSQDILKFGGWLDLKKDDENLGYVRWSADEDLPYIRERLDTFGLPTLDMSEYEKTLEGLHTYDLNLTNALYKGDGQKMFDKGQEARAEYRLGCLIFFQLHMMPTLSVEFEG